MAYRFTAVHRGLHQLPGPLGAVRRGARRRAGAAYLAGASRAGVLDLLHRLRGLQLHRRLGGRPLGRQERVLGRDPAVVAAVRRHRPGERLRLAAGGAHPVRHGRGAAGHHHQQDRQQLVSAQGIGHRLRLRQLRAAAGRRGGGAGGRADDRRLWMARRVRRHRLLRAGLAAVLASAGDRPAAAAPARLGAGARADRIGSQRAGDAGRRAAARHLPAAAGDPRGDDLLLRLQLHPVLLPHLVPELPDHGPAPEPEEHEPGHGAALAARLHRLRPERAAVGLDLPAHRQCAARASGC